jgi:flagellar hook protein FlgE
MASFSIPLTGLNADSTALNTIANNLSNMSTTGFKAQTTSFSDLFYQEVGTAGSGDEIQQGSGVQVATNTTDFTSGSISSTGATTSDAAIEGDGFFVLDNNGGQLLTRNGTFQQSASGTLESSNGLAVMGYGAVNGVVNTNGGLTNITIPTGVMKPEATTNVSWVANLYSTDSNNASFTTENNKIYDALGNSYEATMTFTKTGTNTWSYKMSVPDTITGNSVTAPVTGVTTDTYNFGSVGGVSATVNTGTNLTITGKKADGSTATSPLPTFVPTGTGGTELISDYATNLQAAITGEGIVGVTVTAPGGVLTISGTNFSTSGSVIQDPVASTSASGAVTFDANGNLLTPSADVSNITFSGLSDGAAPLVLNWNVLGSNGTANLTQTANDSTSASATGSTSKTDQDGYAAGESQGFTIASDGTVNVAYSNGKNLAVGQLALATVSNEQGLVAQGGTEYATSMSSGEASIGLAGTGGRGTLEGGNLEGSNVNISAEFSDLIVAQRAFEANSKAVTTFDTVTQEAINMIH